MAETPVPPIVDTHAHLDDASFDSDIDDVIASASGAGVVAIVNIGYRPASWISSRRLRESYPMVSLAIGLHPQHADEFEPDLQKSLVNTIAHLSPVAIGETGLDFSRTGPSFLDQERAFRAQLEIAAAESLPAIIHQRNAGDALMAELDRWPELPALVLHSFDGDRRLMDWAVERGCFIGVGGLATRSSAEGLREVLGHAPPDRLLLETDSPYLTPPGVLNRRNSPANLPAIAARLAPIWHLSTEDLISSTTATANTLFNLGLTVHSCQMKQWCP